MDFQGMLVRLVFVIVSRERFGGRERGFYVLKVIHM